MQKVVENTVTAGIQFATKKQRTYNLIKKAVNFGIRFQSKETLTAIL